MRIEGAVALVTGGNRGLGRAFVRELVGRGARTVYAGARDPEDVTEPGATAVRLDITDPRDVAAAAALCGDVTLLVNNAGIGGRHPLLGGDSMDFARREMETNYFGTLAMCRAFAPILVANGGALVNMLSITSFFSFPTMGSLCATKAALWSLTNGIRTEMEPHGTLVVGVHSGFIDTELSAGFDVDKHDPRQIAALVFDAVEAGRTEVLADERTRTMKAAMGDPL